MHVSLDVSSVPDRPAGAGRYIFELARGLVHASQIDTTLIARRGDEERWGELGSGVAVRGVAPALRPLRLAWEQVRLPSVVKRLDVDVHHGPHYTMPERAEVPVVVTIHDMTFFTNPELHERSKVVVFRRAIEAAVKRATQLIAVSQDTALRVQERFGEVPITVIPHGIDHERFHANADAGERDQLSASGIPGDYIAFVGTIEPRKNLPQLIRAFDVIAERHPTLHLVLAGQRGWQLDAFDATLAASPHRHRILVMGYVDDALVPALLRNAKAVAYPSILEGFGLPALEAMACGTPIVVGEGSAMKEVAGTTGIFVRQDDVESIAHGLELALEADGRPGVDVASAFTWQAAVEAHITVYEKAAGSA
jgi:glycosyltransferase involved in cell wall biosynthesis